MKRYFKRYIDRYIKRYIQRYIKGDIPIYIQRYINVSFHVSFNVYSYELYSFQHLSCNLQVHEFVDLYITGEVLKHYSSKLHTAKDT